MTQNKNCNNMKINPHYIQAVFHVKLPWTRFKARNCISEPGPREPYRDIYFGTPCRANSNKTYVLGLAAGM
jgi:hypothetical protein